MNAPLPDITRTPLRSTPAALAADSRSRCIDCSSYHRPSSRCYDHISAGLATNSVGPQFAAMPQRCPAFTDRSQPVDKRATWSAFHFTSTERT